MRGDAKPLLCPSSRCEDGARLIGIVQGDGTVAFTPDDIRIDAGFVEAAKQGRKPETRFRFAGPCHRANCAQWTGGRCGVVDTVLEQVEAQRLDVPSSLPDCSIRANCRWFAQAGEKACRACPLVVTEYAEPV